MKLRKLFFTAILVAAFTTTMNAQQYDKAFGVRLGYDYGLTLKKFFAPASAGEFILSMSSHHVQLTGLYEYQQPIAEVRGLDWYVGLGAHIGGIHSDRSHYKNGFLLGADLIGGIEYLFPSAPFNVSLDWKPSFNFFNNYNDYWFSPFGLSLRYTFR